MTLNYEWSMDSESLTDISLCIHHTMRNYVIEHPYDIEHGYNNAIIEAIREVMRQSKGCLDPSTIEAMCHMNRIAFQDSNYNLPC
jgi:hypothetical protein